MAENSSSAAESPPASIAARLFVTRHICLGTSFRLRACTCVCVSRPTLKGRNRKMKLLFSWQYYWEVGRTKRLCRLHRSRDLQVRQAGVTCWENAGMGHS